MRECVIRHRWNFWWVGFSESADSSSFTIITYHNFKLHVKSFQIQGTYVSYVITSFLKTCAPSVLAIYVSIIDCNSGRGVCRRRYGVIRFMATTYPAFTTISRDCRHYVYALCCCIAHSSGFRKSYSACTAQTDQTKPDLKLLHCCHCCGNLWRVRNEIGNLWDGWTGNIYTLSVGIFLSPRPRPTLPSFLPHRTIVGG